MNEIGAKEEEPDREPELLDNLLNDNEALPDHRETVKVREMSDVKLEDGKEQEQVKAESDKQS